MKLAIIQQRIFSNNPQRNFEVMKAAIQAHKNQVDIIVFPEMAVGGYMLGDKYNNLDTIHDFMYYNDQLKALSEGTAVIWGNVHHDGKHLYNAAYFAVDGDWAHRASQTDAGIYLKHLLPNYTFFDDKRYFHAGYGNFEPFEFKGQKVAIQICEDMWDETHDMSPTTQMKAYNPDVMINISASPWVKGKETSRLDTIRRHNLSMPFVYVNATGMQNNGKNVVVFDGGSLVVTPTTIHELPQNFEQSETVIDLATLEAHQNPVEHKLYEALIHAIRYFDEETLAYGPKWVVGVSGGLDSSVTVSLLVKALGADRVLGVTMPSKFTRDITKSNAYHLSEKLNFKLLEIPIASMVDATLESLSHGGYDTVEGLSYENIQARLRGHTLMSVSSLENAVVSNNGNKIEVALGYATLYGDAIGALAILGDLTKMEVGKVAQSLNEIAQAEIVPQNLIPLDEATHVSWEFAPSAELKDDQFDPMKWGYHDALIEFLQKDSLEDLLASYLDGTIYNTKLGSYLYAYQLDKPEAFIEDLKWVIRTMNVAVYKRIQMPPIVSVSDYAYGMTYRESQLPQTYTQKQRALIESILKM